MTSKAEVIRKAKLDGKTVHFAQSMDLCHLKNSELEKQFQKYRGRVVLSGDVANDDSGNYAVFAEQGASASHMTAAKVFGRSFKTLGCSGQASDAVSADTQDENERRTRTSSSFGRGLFKHLDQIPKARRPQHWNSIDAPAVPLERKLYGHPLAEVFMGRNI